MCNDLCLSFSLMFFLLKMLLCRPIRQMMEHRSQSMGFGFLGVEGEQKRNTAAWVDGYRFTGCRDASVGGYEYSKHQASICCIFGGQLGRVEPRGALQNVTTKSKRTPFLKHLTTRGETKMIRCCRIDKDRNGSSQDTTLRGKTRRILGAVNANAFDTFRLLVSSHAVTEQRSISATQRRHKYT